jgi:DNA-directed RNA polymerase subunit H (RpoH/RPB5)
MNNTRVLSVYKTELINYLAQLYQFLKLYKRDSPSVERILDVIGIKPSQFEKIQKSGEALKALEKRVKIMKTIKKSNSGNFSYRNNNISFSGLYLSDMLDRISQINL